MPETITARETIAMPGASDAYRDARKKLSDAEAALIKQVEGVAAMRRALPQGPVVRDYEFLESDKSVRLSELFSPSKPELFMYHVMYWADDDKFCPMCSMWIDGLNGVTKHIEQRANFVVASRAPVDKLQAWAMRRGWDNVRLLSDADNTLARDCGAEEANGDPVETVLVFTKNGSEIRNTYISHAFSFGRNRRIDLIQPVWNVLDLLPSARDDWNPSNDYI